MNYRVRVRDRRTGQIHETQVSGDRYLLESLEDLGLDLPAACRHGCCTTCAMRVRSGALDQREVMGLSPALQAEGYALICSSYACSDLELETQDEDEVYQLQFGRYFARAKRRWWQWRLPLDHD